MPVVDRPPLRRYRYITPYPITREELRHPHPETLAWLRDNIDVRPVVEAVTEAQRRGTVPPFTCQDSTELHLSHMGDQCG